ncbi:hypothetical protein [Methylorubrum extorquens]
MTASPFGLAPITDDIATRLRCGVPGIASAFTQASDMAWPSEAG